MNLYKVDYIFKVWPTVYWLNKLCTASLPFVLKKNENLDFKEEKRLEKNDNNEYQCAGCTHYLTNKQILFPVIVHKFFLANKTLKNLFFFWEA